MIKPWGIASILAIALIIANGIFLYKFWRPRSFDNSNLTTSSTEENGIVRITALGRLEPQGEIIQLSAPNGSRRLKEWLVKDGEQLGANQTIAIMYGINQYRAAADSARAKVEVARARLAQVKAGEKPGRVRAQKRKVAELKAQLAGDVDVQRTVIARRKVELEQAKVDYQRYLEVFEQGGVSNSDVEQKRLQKQIIQEQLQEAQATLERTINTGGERIKEAQDTLVSLAQVQEVDIRVAEAELNDALSTLKQAEVDVNSLLVRSPIDGQILSLNTKVGEIVGSQGLATIG
ncbi:MAG: HlyD family secretion protein, partial [Moorea sp. SIO2B7]|nr:HlyD family secretion protein [Moorena sp. SIO2B7]